MTFDVPAEPYYTFAWLSTLIFTVDLLFVTWRLIRHDATTSSNILSDYFRSWMVVDVISTIPWTLLFEEDFGRSVFAYVTVLRSLRLRNYLPILAEVYNNLFPVLSSSWADEILTACALTGAMLHVAACLWCSATVRGKAHLGCK